MALCRYRLPDKTQAGRPPQWGWVQDGRIAPLEEREVLNILVSPGPEGLARLEMSLSSEARADAISLEEVLGAPNGVDSVHLLAPVTEGQEVWAAGVTYESSKLARMAESKEGSDFYARVYGADRPELFFKALAGRVVGPNGLVRIRADSAWNVPEPELTALIAANGRILGYTIGNDMSSRDIEGENPLYLPQAKVYRGSCALGPVVVPAEALDAQNLSISLTVRRNGQTVAAQTTSTSRMRRLITDLAEWLFRENDFPQGVFLLTGTGIIPEDQFTLQPGDVIAIAIAGIGELRNVVAS